MTASREFHVCIHPLDRKEFYAQRKGPWPQPAADNPMGMAAEVMHPARADVRRWRKTALKNYVKALVTKLPLAFHNWFSHGAVHPLSDEHCVRMLTESSYSKFLRRRTAAQIAGTDFGPALGALDPSLQYLITDFSMMKEIGPHPGMHTAPTVTLFSRASEHAPCTMLAISIGHRADRSTWKHEVLTPGHGNAWALAKYFVIQGAGHMISLCGHPATHFPYDTVNAITISAVPKDHTIFRLLKPHLDLHLAVDHAVLEGKHSIVSETRGQFYTPFVGPSEEVRKLVAFGYSGYGDQGWGDNYPPWTYPAGPGDIPSNYGRFLAAYYETIRRYVSEVVDCIHRNGQTEEGHVELYYIRCWARHISYWLPGFPNEHQILGPGPSPGPYPNLVTALTTYIWNVAIAHPLEHSTFGRQGPHHTSFRMRVPPPESQDAPDFERKSIMFGRDMFKSTLAFEIFFKPHNVTCLVDVKYRFKQPELQAAADRFQEDLRKTEDRLLEEGINVDQYVRLRDLASSIQY